MVSKDYREFRGNTMEVLNGLLAQKYVPATMAEIMKRRINNEEFFVKEAFDTSDFLLYDRLKLSRDSVKVPDKAKFVLIFDNQYRTNEKTKQILNNICDIKNFHEGYVHLNKDYDSINGKGIIEVPLKNIEKSWMNLSSILDNQAFRVLSRHPDEVPKEFVEDASLLKEYLKWLKLEIKIDTHEIDVCVGESSEIAKLNNWTVTCCKQFSNPDMWCDSSLEHDAPNFFKKFIGLEKQLKLRI